MLQVRRLRSTCSVSPTASATPLSAELASSVTCSLGSLRQSGAPLQPAARGRSSPRRPFADDEARAAAPSRQVPGFCRMKRFTLSLVVAELRHRIFELRREALRQLLELCERRASGLRKAWRPWGWSLPCPCSASRARIARAPSRRKTAPPSVSIRVATHDLAPIRSAGAATARVRRAAWRRVRERRRQVCGRLRTRESFARTTACAWPRASAVLTSWRLARSAQRSPEARSAWR